MAPKKKEIESNSDTTIKSPEAGHDVAPTTFLLEADPALRAVNFLNYFGLTPSVFNRSNGGSSSEEHINSEEFLNLMRRSGIRTMQEFYVALRQTDEGTWLASFFITGIGDLDVAENILLTPTSDSSCGFDTKIRQLRTLHVKKGLPQMVGRAYTHESWMIKTQN